MNKIIIGCFCNVIFFNIAMSHPGIGIVMDSNGNVFYTDLSHVWKISPEGDCSIVVRNVHTHELYIDAQDNLYGEHEWYEGEATDKWGNYVWRLSKDGIHEKTIADVEGFLDNNTLVRDLEGNSYWVAKNGDYEILKKQTVKGSSTIFTKHHFKDIRWMYFSKTDNSLYVVDYLKIKKITPTGNLEIIADNLKEDSPPFERVADRHYIFGLWTDKNKNVYAAVYGAGKVQKINSKGEKITVFTSQEGWSPCGGMIAPDGAQWIMEFSTNNKTRIRKISVDGNHILYGE